MSGLYWEVWAIPTSNMLAAEETEAEALAIVREFLATDWTPDELVLIFDDPAIPDQDLPLGTSGDELARRAEAAGTDPARRRSA